MAAEYKACYFLRRTGRFARNFSVCLETRGGAPQFKTLLRERARPPIYRPEAEIKTYDRRTDDYVTREL